ncbi:MAG TPA: hypothetical protein DDZ78_01745, partial [Porphyromonadaceae bacterium]|nr:hypothetical protein [Porphyromonadaceae bacterium]
VFTDDLPDILERNTDALIQGVYGRSVEYAFWASRHDDFGQKSIDLAVDLSSEDMVHYSNKQWFITFYQFNDRAAANTYSPARQWAYGYAQIRDLNNIIIALADESKLSEAEKNLKGEALALRAFHYFTLINLYQTAGEWSHIKDLPGVPVYTEVTLEGKGRGTVAETYDRILADYEAAIPLLKGFAPPVLTRITQVGAKLLAARAYLYTGDYAKALTYSTEVVNATSLMPTSEYTKGFADISNVEWLWGADITSVNSTSYASFFSIIDGLSPGYAGALGQYKTIDKRLYDNIHANDVRKDNFEGADGGEYEVPYFQLKFVDASKKFLGDYVYLRAAEAYYIKAESEVRTNDIEAAKKTLDLISNARAKSGTHSYTWASTPEALLDQIFVQKRIELWGEGHALFEFNRLEKTIDRTYQGTNHPAANIIGGDRPLPWHDALRTFQIPIKEIEGDDAITEADQNP